MNTKRVEFQLTVQITVRHDEGVGHVSCCPALDVFSQGNTEEEARRNLCEALQLFIVSCCQRGTLGQVLMNCGLEPDNDPIRIEESDNVVHIPLPLISYAKAEAS